MRISDWSSDVCSSDLAPDLKTRGKRVRKGRNGGIPPRFARARCHLREVAGLRDLKGGPLDFGPRPKLVLSACQGSRKAWGDRKGGVAIFRSEEHTSELQSLMRISYAVFCLKNTNHNTKHSIHHTLSSHTCS